MKPSQLAAVASSVQKHLRERGELVLTARPYHGKVLLEFNGEPFARLQPMPDTSLRLSHYTHMCKWESLPFAPKTPIEAADLMLEVLGPHIQALSMG
jgi:hypothetical protein